MKRKLSLFLTIVMILSFMTASVFSVSVNAQTSSTKDVVVTEFTHLTEVPNGYVGIYTKSDLDAIRNNLNGNYILMNDVKFSVDDFSEAGQFYNSGKGWNSIGNSETPFTGTFDGNGYCINGLVMFGDITESMYVGLFGYNKGCIKNITITGQIAVTHASNTVYVGMVAGYSEGTIENCKSVGDISVESTILRATYETPYSYVGGITGCSVGTLSLCENTCDIQATPVVIAYAEAVTYLGGVAGVANSSTVSNCINSGTITLAPTLDENTGITVYAGGISGQSDSNTTGCDNSGSIIIEESKVSISTKFYAAGIIGYSTGTITGSSNSGTVRARGVYAYSGGVAGYNTGTLSQCSNIGNVMAITTSTGSGAYAYGYSGGIAGYSTGTTSECYNTGFVEVSEANASEATYSAGIVSYQKGGTIINCYNAGYVPDKTYYGDTGGIAGYSTGSISLCYNIGRVPEGYPSGAGAVVGYTSEITPNCFFLDDNKVGVAEGKNSTISCSKEVLLLAETYTGFDFDSVWEIGVYDTYPCATLKNVEHKGSIIGNNLFAGGTGTAYDPFLIENAEQLNNVRVIPSAYYELVADIAFKDSDYAEGGTFYNNGEGWLPIMYFVGSFDGCGHVISNLQIDHAPTSSISSYSTSNEKYARFYDDNFGLFGFNCGGTISRVGVTGNIYVKKFDSYSLDYAYVGGIAGQSNGTINECYFVGNVYGTAEYSSLVGGICGKSWNPEGTLKNCFSQGTFTGPTTIAVEVITNGSYANCYSVGRVVKKGSSADIAVVTGSSGSAIDCTDAEMKIQGTYADFDFNSVWTMEGDVHYLYPKLQSVKLDPSLISHTFTKEDTTYLKTEATCTSPAIYYKSCSVCGEKGEETFEYGEVLGHTGGTATCTAKAECTRCHQPYGETLEHVYTDEDATDTYLKSAATCTSKAVYYKNCATCDEASNNVTFEYGSKKEHSYTRQVISDTYKVSGATCTAKAVYSYCCATCDAKGENTYTSGSTLDHSYTRQVIEDIYKVSDADCDSTAVYKYCCATCTAAGTETFGYGGVLGHTGGTATCTEKAECSTCGKEYGTFGGHTYGTLINAVAEKHTQTELVASVAAHYQCSVCNKYFTTTKAETTLEALTGATPSHSYGAWQTTDDKHWKECSCGLVSEENDHVYDNTSDMICNICEHDRTLPHTHGNGVKQNGQAATCIAHGWNDYYKCSCGKFYTEEACTNEITDLDAWKAGAGKIAAGHTFGTLIFSVSEKHTQTELVASVATHYHCSVCGKYFTEAKVETTLDALTGTTPSHSYGNWQNDADKHWKECTCGRKSDEGNHVDTDSNNKCDICDKILTTGGGVTPPPAHTHNYGTNWQTDGTNHWYECECGEKKDSAIHNGGTATCEEKAKCTVCQAEYGELADHKYSEATCTAKAKCSVCGDEKGEFVAHTYVDGKCSCGALDPNYQPPHEHNFVEGKCVCGEIDTNYQPPHEHCFVDGKCECGELDSNYISGTDTEPNKSDTDVSTPSDNDTDDENDGLSGGAIAGIAVGSTVVAGAGGFSLFWFVIKKKRFSDLLKIFKKK